MKITIGDYVIRPYRNGLCWTVDKWSDVVREGREVRELVSTQKFPTSLHGAVVLVAEMATLESEKEINGIAAIPGAIEELKNELLSKVTVATATPRKRK